MPLNGHLSWRTVSRPGQLKAVAYKKGRRTLTQTVYTSGPATQVQVEQSVYEDITILDITLLDKKNHFAATACDSLLFSFEGAGEIIGCGNGDPACHLTADQWIGKQQVVFPAFNGHAQVILRGPITSYQMKLMH